MAVRAIDYDNCADVYRELHEKLRKGEHLLVNWDESKTISPPEHAVLRRGHVPTMSPTGHQKLAG